MSEKSYRAHADDVSFERPHVFILGAGASRAAFPNGDANGKHLPLMSDLVETLDLAPVLEAHSIRWTGGNFEELYARLTVEMSSNNGLTNEIETRLQAYFAQLRLPEAPTLYDHLVLSLRSKDVIATFNWDPFLFDACARNAHRAGYPRTFFLHGNVRVGFCADDRTAGPLTLRCPKCHHLFRASRLVCQVTTKNYTTDPYIGAQWNNLKHALQNAYMLTIFGYSAPQSDAEAVALMREAWGTPETRNLEEIEVIDLKDRDQLRKTWSPFIHTHHYRTYDSWYHSWTAEYPRRTCEAMWSTLMENNPHQPARLPTDADFAQLWAWVDLLLKMERKQT